METHVAKTTASYFAAFSPDSPRLAAATTSDKDAGSFN